MYIKGCKCFRAYESMSGQVDNALHNFPILIITNNIHFVR